MGLEKKSLIEQGDNSNLEIAATTLSNSEGDCIEKNGDLTTTTVNALKTKIPEIYNVVKGSGQLTQSDSQCAIGSSTTTVEPDEVPSALTFTE